MSLKLTSFGCKKIGLSLLIVITSVSVFAKDPAIGRAELMNQISEEDISKQSLRYKIIRSRALVLYMLDILPNKGNPYFHMAEFASLSTLPAFNAAQDTTSKFMNSDSPSYWLPIEKDNTLSATQVKDPQILPVIDYFAQFVATADIMEKKIQPVLAQSIIIGSVSQTAGPVVDEKFQKTWRYIKFVSARYKALLTAHPETESRLAFQKKKMNLVVLSVLAKGMKPYLPYVTNSSNEASLVTFLETLATLDNIDDFSLAKNRVSTISQAGTNSYQQVSQALESVGLPDSGDIDGADEAFEIAMRLEVGFDIIQSIIREINEKW